MAPLGMPDPVAAQVRSLGTIACVFAHPDDEAYLAGGLMAAAVALGQRVRCVIATAGEAGGDAAVRRDELAAALAALGVEDHVVLDLPDGRCAATDPLEAMARIGGCLRQLDPDTVVTFDDHGHTGHPDHVAVGRWTTEVVSQALPGARLLHTAVTAGAAVRHPAALDPASVFEPGLPVLVPEQEIAVDLWLDGDLLDRKVAALQAHRSQTAALVDELGADAFRRWVSVEAFQSADQPADQPSRTRPQPAAATTHRSPR